MEALAIRTVVDNWVLWRDAGNGNGSAACGMTTAYMMATWFQGTADEFIRVSQEGFNRGVNILHFQGAFTRGYRRHARHLANQDDHQSAGAGSRRALRRGLHRALLRFLREAQQSLGHRAAGSRFTKRIAWTRWIRESCCRSIRSC